MKARIIDGKSVALQIRQEAKQKLEARPRKDKNPGLAVLLVGDDPASHVYVRNKAKACNEVGVHSITKNLSKDITEEELLSEIERLNNDPQYHGILVQLPLPPQIDPQKIIESISPEKDVDCFHPFNVGRLMIGMPVFLPATPAGILELLKRYQISPSGKHLVIIGRSNIVGKPLANLCVQKTAQSNAIVTVVHSAAKDVAHFTKQADILVAAMGKPGFVRAGMVKDGAVVIDVGTNRVEAPETKKGYRLVGDVAFDEVAEVASFITPVPGGVGPMTIAMLLLNTVTAFELQTR